MSFYTTYHEMTFIRKIGHCSDIKMNRYKLLENYLNTIPLRVYWMGMDRNAIRNFCITEMDREAAK